MESTKRTKDQGNIDVSNQGGTPTSPANLKEQGTQSTTGHQDKQNQQMKSPNQPGARGQASYQGGLPSNETIDQAKQAVTDVYNRASQGLNETYNQAIDYGRENPGKMTLIAFGAGIGVGLLLSSGFSSRNRTDRIIPPVMNALSAIAAEFFR